MWDCRASSVSLNLNLMLDWGADGQYTDGGPKMNETPASSEGRTGNQHLLLASELGSLCSSTGTAGYHSAFWCQYCVLKIDSSNLSSLSTASSKPNDNFFSKKKKHFTLTQKKESSHINKLVLHTNIQV